MAKYYKAVVEVLVQAESEVEAEDGLSEAMRGILNEFTEEPSCLIDWRYAGPSGSPEEHSGVGFEYAEG